MGLDKARPPNLTGNVKGFLSWSFGGSHSIRAAGIHNVYTTYFILHAETLGVHGLKSVFVRFLIGRTTC